MSLSSWNKLLVSLSFFACTSLFAAPITIDVSGIESYGELGDAGNTVLNFDVGASGTVTSISYSFNLTAIDPSWLSEIGLSFTNSKGTEGVVFNPGVGDAFPGTDTYSGSANLADLGLSFTVGSDGILRLEFYEDYDDFGGPDGIWNFGSITFNIEPQVIDVPEPSTALLLGAGVMLIGYSRRKGAQKKNQASTH
ncbi:PEP-CTERM sorting domain-containing protein [Massilia sp. CF038]|uniref:PEP-CTERM sorting domain-containing protein n=1 Tax=Massilia sp. CF038 TaxID=1881045 RepID=UPI0009138B3A|nr:PEP-CTERM sorting domain-containing protein [Massilia sp. CF038]SHH09699.1 PEP-CTERM protein-sorting domain-containing protein [Massilia sp. CF038]